MRTAIIACSVAIITVSGCASSPSSGYRSDYRDSYRAERFSDARQERQLQRDEARRDDALAQRDQLITSQIREQFARDPAVDARDIAVDTNRGTVELSGYVDQNAAIRHAVRIALATPGVRTVRNDMRVTRP
jgi:hyperosmotically inducible periplasmic protein